MATAIPTPQQIAWAEAEVGVIIHLDVQVFEPGYDFRAQRGYTPSPQVFNPGNLDTEQWITAAVAGGARYAVLVAKHCSGFCLWPTAAHPYSVASTPWRGGKGDVVADFVASCKRHGIRAGVYYSTSCNAFLGVDNPGRVLSGDAAAQAAYNRVVEQQLTELWTRYGKWSEIWFDGGVLPVAEGGADVPALVTKLQPDAVLFQGPPECRNLLRWVGNESGQAPPDCWAATDMLSADDGTRPRKDLDGSPDGAHWSPSEADMPGRDQGRAYMGGWFWRAGEDHLVYDAEHLFARYLGSVGRNANLLVGMVIGPDGQVPQADADALAGLGRLVRERLGTPLAASGPHRIAAGKRIELHLPQMSDLTHIELLEDISAGHRIRGWRLEAEMHWGLWTLLEEGHCIGHKRISPGLRIRTNKVILTITEASGEACLARIAAYGRTV